MSTKTQIRSMSNKPLPKKRGQDFVSLDGMLTVEQWVAMPDTKPRYELIEGRLVQKMTTTTGHAQAAGKFYRICDEWADTSGWKFLPEGTGVDINEHTAYVPDVVGFAPNVKLDSEASVNQPTLVVEVLSKGTSKRDRTDKKRDYARIGVPLYLIINTKARTIEVFRLKNDIYSDPEVLRENDVWQPAELPGLRLEAARLWL